MDEEQQGDDRRDFLKKVAVGGAVAWTAPIAPSSSASAAPAGSPPPTSTSTTVPEVCVGNGEWNCSGPYVQCGTAGLSDICVCEVDIEGNDICWAQRLVQSPQRVRL